MKYPDQIKTIVKFNQKSYKEKGSEFIARIYNVEEQNEIVEILNKLKKKYYGATHHCYAYKLLNGKIKYSDDGEPGGSAGIRILKAIEHFDLVNQLVVVTRYFGGIKLGVGPLGKAYYNTTFNVLEQSEIVVKNLYYIIYITSAFNNISHLHSIINQHNSKIENSAYHENLELKCLILPSKLDIISAKLNDVGKGEIMITRTEESIYL
ncbi:MAG: YigZ family protein [Ignavibacteria bacterium]|nr:YigZ family protein [Ignavibacteria bacterium]